MIDAAADGRPPGRCPCSRPRFASDFPRSLTAHDIGLRILSNASCSGLPDISLITVS